MNELLIKIVEVDKMPKKMGGAISWRTPRNSYHYPLTRK